MLPRRLGKMDTMPRGMWTWPLLVLLVAAQLAAFWMLCNQQVRKANARNANVYAQQVAVADCLHQSPRATWSSCASRVDPSNPPDGSVVLTRDNPTATGAAGRPALGAAMPVNFTYR